MSNPNRKGPRGKRGAKSDPNSSRQDPGCNSSTTSQALRTNRDRHTNDLSSSVVEALSTLGRSQFTPADDWIPGVMEHERTLRLANNSFVTSRFTDLQLERNYLLDSLQKADERATRLVRVLAHTQAKLDHSPIRDKSVSHFKRQCNKLKQRLRECENAEKAILDNLGRVSWQIQATERWINAEQYSSKKAPMGERIGVSQISHDLRRMTLDPRTPVFPPQSWDGVTQSGRWMPEQEGVQFCASNWISPIYSPFYNSAYDQSNHHNHYFAHGLPVEEVYQPVLAAVQEDKLSKEVSKIDTSLRRTSETYLDLLDKNDHPLERVRTRSLPAGFGDESYYNGQDPKTCAYQGYGILGERPSGPSP